MSAAVPPQTIYAKTDSPLFMGDARQRAKRAGMAGIALGAAVAVTSPLIFPLPQHPLTFAEHPVSYDAYYEVQMDGPFAYRAPLVVPKQFDLVERVDAAEKTKENILHEILFLQPLPSPTIPFQTAATKALTDSLTEVNAGLEGELTGLRALAERAVASEKAAIDSINATGPYQGYAGKMRKNRTKHYAGPLLGIFGIFASIGLWERADRRRQEQEAQEAQYVLTGKIREFFERAEAFLSEYGGGRMYGLRENAGALSQFFMNHSNQEVGFYASREGMVLHTPCRGAPDVQLGLAVRPRGSSMNLTLDFYLAEPPGPSVVNAHPQVMGVEALAKRDRISLDAEGSIYFVNMHGPGEGQQEQGVEGASACGRLDYPAASSILPRLAGYRDELLRLQTSSKG
jgi:hypothetical protein